jgi:hypothetical protein
MFAGDVVLEEDLQLDCAPDGLLLLPRLPYLGGERLGTVIDMLLVGDQIGGYRPSCLPAEVRGFGVSAGLGGWVLSDLFVGTAVCGWPGLASLPADCHSMTEHV